MFIFKDRVTSQIGEITMGDAVKFFGEKTTCRLRDGVLCGVINKFGSLRFKTNAL